MRAWLLGIALVAAAAAIVFARPHATPGPPMRDFEAYYAAGATWNASQDPYSQSIWRAERVLSGVNDSHYEALPFVAPPALLPVFGAIAKLPFSAANALWRFTLLAVICALVLVTLKLARLRITAPRFIAAAVCALGFGPVTSALALGQLALPAMLFASLAVLRPAAGLFAWMQPNIGIALVSQARWWIGALAFGFVCAAVAGPSGLQHYAAFVHQHSLAERFSAIQITPAAIAYGFGAAPATASAIGACVALASLCCWFLLVRGTRDGVARFSITCAMLPLAMPFFHEHDLLVLFVPALLYAIRCDTKIWPLAAFGALLAGTDWLGLAQRPDATVQTLLLTAALGSALLVLRDRITLRMLLVPAGTLALVAVAAVIAQLHPAPIWPDAMRALPANIGSFDITSAWNAEQRAAGLFAPQAVWALLRMFSLAGCTMVAAAIAVSSKSPADSRSSSLGPALGF